ncbi:hypothetical protein ES703_121354 [subsurface metagenome]
MIKKLTPIIAILTIGALEAFAISQGVNGVLLAGSIAVIAGLGGYAAKVKTPPAKGNDKK